MGNMADRLFDATVGALNTSLNLRLMQQNVIASNIANADTPDYKAQAMDFEQAFRDALGAGTELAPAKTDPGHAGPNPMDPVFPEIYDDPNGVESLDGNTVNRSVEMAKLKENQLMYDASVEMMRRKLAMIKYGVNEGGR